MEEKQAQTTAEREVVTSPAEVDANAGTDRETEPATDAGTTDDSVNDAAFEDSTADGAEKEPVAKGANKKQAQSKEQNAENARRRREAERQKELRETRDKTIIDTLRGKNPYTNEEMKDSADVEEYLDMRRIEENGGDPVADYPKYRKQKDRDAVRASEENAQKEEWYRNDFESFAAEYPDVDVDELVGDEDFRDYADGKIGRKSFSEIYRGYLKLTSKMEARAKEIAAQKLANRAASPGALHNTASVESDFYTPEQVRKMNAAEVSRNYDKIMESMKKWK